MYFRLLPMFGQGTGEYDTLHLGNGAGNGNQYVFASIEDDFCKSLGGGKIIFRMASLHTTHQIIFHTFHYYLKNKKIN